MIRKLTLKKEREHETNEASIAGNVMRDLIAHVTNDNLIGRKIKSGELRKKMVEPPWKCPDMFTMTTIEMEHFTMEWLELKENPNEQKVILQLHGGGYIGAMRNAYRMFAGLYNEVSKGMSVLTMNRVSDDPYTIEYGYAEIKNIANEAKSVPTEWINAAGNDVTQELIDYLTPLIQGESNVTYENGLPVYMDVSHLTKHQ